MEVNSVVEVVIVRQQDGSSFDSPTRYRDQYVDAGVGKEHSQKGC